MNSKMYKEREMLYKDDIIDYLNKKRKNLKNHAIELLPVWEKEADKYIAKMVLIDEILAMLETTAVKQ